MTYQTEPDHRPINPSAVHASSQCPRALHSAHELSRWELLSADTPDDHADARRLCGNDGQDNQMFLHVPDDDLNDLDDGDTPADDNGTLHECAACRNPFPFCHAP